MMVVRILDEAERFRLAPRSHRRAVSAPMKFLTAILALVAIFSLSACATHKAPAKSCCGDGKCDVKKKH